MLEKQAGTGGYDVLLISPAWLADFVRNGAVEPLDPYIEKYGVDKRVRRHQSGLQGLDELQRQDLRAGRRWRRARHLLPQGSLRGSGEPEGLQGEVRLRSRAAQDLQGVRRYRLLPDGEVSARDLWRRRHQHRLHAFLLLRALPQLWRQVLRSGDDEGDGQQRGRRQGADRDGRAEQVHVARHRDLGLCRESLGAECRRDRHDHLLAAAGRWTQGVNIDDKALSWVPQDRGSRQDRLCAQSRRPSGARFGLHLGVSPDSKNKDAAYLYVQWMHSKHRA